MDTFTKQTRDQLDYDVDFSIWIPEGDIITTAEATLDIEGDLQIDATQIDPELGQIIKVWLSGGIDGKTYKITVAASTSQGRVKETEFRLRVKDL